MGKYLKMSDVFNGAVGFCFHGDIFDNDVFFGTIDMDKCEAAAHAINSHDELVENMQHYKQEAEQWETRASNEASRVKYLEAEVERLRGVASELSGRLQVEMKQFSAIRSYTEDGKLACICADHESKIDELLKKHKI